ncbi:phage baseplate assembly protein V [Vibrio lentus]|uniref:Baseplate assembly protein V n=1 Tax=Vibrio tasmaniensis TaxID=212663 RepID=A0A0H3ZTQ1_9VIBR|nr:phage baseplate assembly protein V [Vibrio lentus]AKN39733.1 Baseplate assembly protein V [Vibrio tasmaniensis]PMI58301.1 hypothetical protein BCU41_03975 [Vibrio lentus]
MRKAILKLIEEVDGLKRQQNNLIRLGNVKELVGRKVVVDYDKDSDDDYYSPQIPFATIYAGEVLNWRAPTVGEQVIVINLSGGIDESSAIAIPSLYCDEFNPDDDLDPNKTYTTFNDVFRVETDSDGNHTLTAKESISFITKAFTIKALDSVEVRTKSYSRTATTATTKGKHSQNGSVGIKGSLDVSVSVKTPVLSNYAGTFAMDGGGTIMNSATVNGVVVETHVHLVDKEGKPTEKPQ